LRTGDFEASWEGRFARIDATIDPQTRTVGVIVAVDNPYEKIKPGIRPPLVRNMFCEVELKGRAIPNRLVIPRSALHEGYIYAVNPENRLSRKKVEIDFSQTNFYVVNSGVNPGERIVVSDLIPAIDGMLLEPIEDVELDKQLMAEASGLTHIK
jgi:multidrug efflux pump subunit AcrA (membrane-fusion protein)